MNNDIKIGDIVKIIKGKFKGFEGKVDDIIGNYAYCDFPARASLGLNTPYQVKISDLIVIPKMVVGGIIKSVVGGIVAHHTINSKHFKYEIGGL